MIQTKQTKKHRSILKISRFEKTIYMAKNTTEYQIETMMRLSNIVINIVEPYLWGSLKGNFLFTGPNKKNCLISMIPASHAKPVITVGVNNNEVFYKKGELFPFYKKQMDKHFERIILTKNQ